MNWFNSLRLSVAALGATLLMVSVGMSEPQNLLDMRKDAETKMQQGNFKEAVDVFRKLVADPAADPRIVARDLSNAVQCLRNLGRVDETDELIESTVKVHEKNWRLLEGAAQLYMQDQHFGFMIAGKFVRGQHRGQGQLMSSLERDRVRAMQLFDAAIPLALKDEAKGEAGDFFHRYAAALLYNRGHLESWRLQYLTDLKVLPDYEEGWPYFRSTSAAPVDAEGKPIYHSLPKTWEEAKTDGEKWRYAQMQAAELNPGLVNQVRLDQAGFYQNQFGVETMQQFGWFNFSPPSDEDKNESGTYELHTLKETETIAKLATGIKRFTLPDEFNYLKIYQTVAAEKSPMSETAVNALAQAFLNRRQFVTGAQYWKQSIEQYNDPNNWKQQQLDQIVKNWGQFEPVTTQPAGEGATVDFRFRNGKKVTFTANAIKVDELLKDVKDYLKSDPGQLDWQKINIGDLGWQLVHQNQAKYVGDEVAKWDLDLKPRENHFDRRVTVATPLQKAGAYLVTATVEGGNVSKIVLWVADTAIVRKQLSEKNFYFVGNAVNGSPIAGANLEFFGYQQKHLGNNRWQTLTTNFAEKTDADGQIFPNPADLKQDYQWLVTARGEGGKFAYLGFEGVWSGRYHDAEYNQVKVFSITDRPVYRPKQKVNFKFWVRRAQYDQEGSEFANRTFPVQIMNPKGEKIYEQTLKADEFAGLSDAFELKEDAMLGVYQITLVANDVEKNVFIAQGGNTFRVEEYKKPEFEVKVDAPTEPVMLGEKIKAKVTAKYYFGSPVANAKVKYKVTRNEHSDNWFPNAPWDWYYGPGYWWFAYDYPWYPGFRDWCGCKRPFPVWWFHGNQQPPELVAENEVQIGPDGTFDVEIDTAVTKELHGNSDHQYTITAEVRDESRRTIVGTGNVLVARKPFKVFSWLDKGYYRVGDSIVAQFSAQTLDKKPVEGTGKLTLFKISYIQDKETKGLKPLETPVRVWDVNTNAAGQARQQLSASARGQYRLAYKLTDKQGHTIEGAYIFTIRGDANDGLDFRFAHLELIPDKQDYQPEQKVKLQINTNQPDSTVLLFVRPANGVYLPPKVIRMKGKSTVEEIEVTKKDMPNFFVEAVTISAGDVFNEVKELVVPPEKRVLNIAIKPSAQEYKPGEKAKVKFTVTEFNGEPYAGSTVVSIYDKSVEYISGGSNVPDIKDFFWKWRRQHQPTTQSSLAKGGHNLTLPNQPGMGPLGIFGNSVADEFEAIDGQLAATGQMKTKGNTLALGQGGGFGGGGRGGFAPPAPGMAPGRAMMMMANGKPGAALAAAPANNAIGADKDAAGDPGAPGGGEQPLVEATVRSNFADTALWNAAITTGKNGEGEVELTMPENLSAWKIRVWGMGHGTRVGSGDAEVVTRKNLILRLQAPRFFIQKDEVVLSANVHNYLKTEKEVTVSLELPDKQLKAQGPLTQKVTIPAGGEKRVDWRVDVVEEGTATVRMKALTNEESDATEQKLPCYVHGMLKTESFAGTLRPDKESSTVKFTVPAARRVPQSLLEVRYSPTLAGSMVDALPFLVDYPHGCTEQTLNRFLPTVITQKVLLEMKVNLADIRDKRTNLNAQEIGVDTERAKQWKRFDRNPVFDEAEVDRMVKDGLKALTNMQVSDGGWGWFSGFGERSWPHTTAVVVHGLQIAQQNDVPLVPGVLERGIDWLKRYQAEQVQWIKNSAIPNARPAKPRADDLDAFIYMVLVDAKAPHDEMREFLYRDRVELGVYSKAMFGLALHKQGGHAEEFAMIVRNCEQFLVEDAENETAFLRLPGNSHWWAWYGSETEANAYFLKLLCLAEPKGPRAPRLVKYLLNNRKHATYWNSTRDTALVVEAFADYLRATNEIAPNMVVELWLDGKKQKEVEIKPENLFTFDNKLLVEGDRLTDGSHTLEIKRRGEGPVYFNAYVTNFTLEDHITAAGLEVKVNRKYYKLTPVKKEIKVVGDRGQALDQRVEKYERAELKDGDELTSGDLVEIELEIDSKNDYEYLLFEDMKAAGFEPVDVRSGYTNNAMGAYAEFRDNRVAFFVRTLARGKHSLAYRMRAEIPGKFAALPTRASAMYAPELRGNSDEIKLKIKD